MTHLFILLSLLLLYGEKNLILQDSGFDLVRNRFENLFLNVHEILSTPQFLENTANVND